MNTHLTSGTSIARHHLWIALALMVVGFAELPAQTVWAWSATRCSNGSSMIDTVTSVSANAGGSCGKVAACIKGSFPHVAFRLQSAGAKVPRFACPTGTTATYIELTTRYGQSGIEHHAWLQHVQNLHYLYLLSGTGSCAEETGYHLISPMQPFDEDNC